MTNTIELNGYKVDMVTHEVWVKKGGTSKTRLYWSKITSARKIKKLVKLAMAQSHKPHNFQIGDRVRVRQAGGGVGDTVYEIAWLGLGSDCIIQQEPFGALRFAGQQFDTSLLVKA